MKQMKKHLIVLFAGCLAAGNLVGGGAGVFCKYCGFEARDARMLLAAPCPKHPNGFAKGKHSPAR